MKLVRVRKTDSLPAPANVNIQDLVGSLKQHMESNGAAASHSGEIDLQHLLQPLQESNEVATQVAAVRLENCRSIKPAAHGRKIVSGIAI